MFRILQLSLYWELSIFMFREKKKIEKTLKGWESREIFFLFLIHRREVRNKMGDSWN